MNISTIDYFIEGYFNEKLFIESTYNRKYISLKECQRKNIS